MSRKVLWMAGMMALGAGAGMACAEEGDVASPAPEVPGGQAPAGQRAAAPSPDRQTPTDRIVARFMALDADESGGVSLDEYMAMVQQRAEARYRAMDANGDGEVTDEEYRAFWKQRMAKWYRLRR